MAKKNVSAIETGAGFFQGLITGLMDVTREQGAPFGALYRLATPAGRTTLGKIVAIAHEDWLAVQSLLGKSDDGASTITIPADATAKGLVSDAKAEFERVGIQLTHFNEDLLQLVRRDLELVRGKTCKVLVQNFGRDWETSEGRDWQKSVDADGNAAAYLVWVTKTKPMGGSVSIANDDARLFRYRDGDLFAPSFRRFGDGREFVLLGVRLGWLGSRSLVAFSAI